MGNVSRACGQNANWDAARTGIRSKSNDSFLPEQTMESKYKFDWNILSTASLAHRGLQPLDACRVHFQKDGAPEHTANVTQQWLHANCPEIIEKDQWPPNSPDLSPLTITCGNLCWVDITNCRRSQRRLSSWNPLCSQYGTICHRIRSTRPSRTLQNAWRHACRPKVDTLITYLKLKEQLIKLVVSNISSCIICYVLFLSLYNVNIFNHVKFVGV